MRMSSLGALVTAGGVLLLASSAATAKDNWIGTWKLDPAASKFSPGPPMKSLTITFKATPAGTKLMTHLVHADGKEMHGEYTSSSTARRVRSRGIPDRTR